MKYTVLTVITFFFLVYGFYLSQRYQTIDTTPVHTPIVRANVPDPVISPSYPVKVSIPAIDLNASVEQVGLDEKERMEVPTDFKNVGWYRLGYFPGTPGSVVMAGHVDTKEGAPAVFAHINQLKKGDEIIVKDNTNNHYQYVVIDKKMFPYDQVPLSQVFGAKDYERLNLITCTGTFNTKAQNYSDRLVVYAIRKEELPQYKL